VARAFVRERFEELLDERERKIFVDQQHLAIHRYVEHEERTAREIDDDARERFIEGHVCVAEATDAGFIAERFRERFAEHERGVFDGVVIIDVDVARGANVEIDLTVTRDHIEHVAEKSDGRRDVGAAGAVEVDRDVDRRFFRGAGDLCDAVHAFSSAARKRSFCSRDPTDTRRQPSRFGYDETSRMRMPAAQSDSNVARASRQRNAMKFARDGNGSMPSIARIAANRRSRSAMIAATFASRYARFSSATIAVSSLTTLRLYGNFALRISAAVEGVVQSQPRRRAARPQAFEKVEQTTKRSSSGGSSSS